MMMGHSIVKYWSVFVQPIITILFNKFIKKVWHSLNGHTKRAHREGIQIGPTERAHREGPYRKGIQREHIKKAIREGVQRCIQNDYYITPFEYVNLQLQDRESSPINIQTVLARVKWTEI